MAGFKDRPGEKVNTIKNLLKERYKQGFPIIKEIIQNANDGQATTLDFGIAQGLGDSVEHPLLKTPALFFLNNGTFTKSDQEAITYFGIDANAKDRGKIGKFGLGQKSIFHFCEAFFYIARSESIPDGCGQFINPWATPDGKDTKRPEWVELSNQDRESLERYLFTHNLVYSNNDSSPYFFLLWVPLRHRMVDERCILANYYDSIKSAQESLPGDMEVRIGQLLPLLRHLKNIRFFIENNPGNLDQQFFVSLVSDEKNVLSRCIYPNATSERIVPDEHELQGKIHLSSKESGIKFSGKERILSEHNFLSLLNRKENFSDHFWIDLQQSPFWSKRVSVNEDGEDEIVPDKSIPHCAVVWTKQSLGNQSEAKLTLQWTVFLPLASEDNHSQQEEAEQEAHQEINCDGDQDYTIFLHGYFFLDSGRKYIEGLRDITRDSFRPKTPENEDEMIAQWNYLLATKGTLRLVLPSLNAFYQKHSLTDVEISNLCRAILKSRLFTSEVYLRSICAEHQWIFRTQPSNDGWELISVNANLRSLPGIPPKWEAFPALKDLAQNYDFIIDGKPNLLSPDKNGRWEKQEICSLLDSLDSELIFSNPNYLRYLTQLLNLQENIIQQPEVQASLINLLRQGFSKIPLSHLQGQSLKPLIKQLVSKISPHKRFKLKILQNDNALNTMINYLYKIQINMFIVCEDFEVSPNSQGILTREELISILTCMKNFIETNRASNCQELACQIIVQFLSSSNHIEQALNQLEDGYLFIGYNYKHEKRYLYNYKKFKYYHQRNCLFKGKWTSQISTGLKESLPNNDLIFIDKKLAEIFGKTSSLKNIPECNVNSCLQLLATQPDLAQADQRTNLLKELINHV
ncbi:sacsin N-terminal ATP-binding-like domain-containing protein [Limnospira platensis]|uniref:sacsin N-terminal ATP-binding-like domain-containing protein n=1 Tax=Limnospira platensis TaxID=118562 RepID=UPI003D6DC15D